MARLVKAGTPRTLPPEGEYTPEEQLWLAAAAEAGKKGKGKAKPAKAADARSTRRADSRACRDAFALTLKDMMAVDKSVCYVDCDLMGCVNTKQLMATYPDRAYEAGIAEANAAGVCAGLAATGKKVYLHTFGTFASRRFYDRTLRALLYLSGFITCALLGAVVYFIGKRTFYYN